MFTLARQASPCILVLDNVESIAQRRGNDTSEEKSFDRLLSCLLTELDGLYSANNQVFVIGTTQDRNRLDSSILRPGRLELHIPFSLPTPAIRLEVLTHLLRDVRFVEQDRDPVLSWLMVRTSDSSYAALKGLVTRAVMTSFQTKEEVVLSKELFQRVLDSYCCLCHTD